MSRQLQDHMRGNEGPTTNVRAKLIATTTMARSTSIKELRQNTRSHKFNDVKLSNSKFGSYKFSSDFLDNNILSVNDSIGTNVGRGYGGICNSENIGYGGSN